MHELIRALPKGELIAFGVSVRGYFQIHLQEIYFSSIKNLSNVNAGVVKSFVSIHQYDFQGEYLCIIKNREMNNNCEIESKPKTLKELVKSSRFWKPATGLIIGGILGYLYYHFVGCASGTCAITGNPVSSIIFGGAMGLFIVSRPCSSC